jgi:hypothetical protein
MRLKKAARPSILRVGSQNDPPQWTDASVMNQRVSPPGTAKGRKAWLFLSLMLPALASKVSTQATTLPAPFDGGPAPLVPGQAARPYLAFVGPPPLRFEDLLPPPDLSTPPAAGAPPKVSEREATETVAPKSSIVASAPVRPVADKTVIAAPRAPAVAPILPDDVPSQVHPEDFLPYFQLPGDSVGPQAAPAAPRTIPPSSATYTQQ